MKLPWARGSRQVGDVLWNGDSNYKITSAPFLSRMDKIDKELQPAINSMHLERSSGNIIRAMNFKVLNGSQQATSEEPTNISSVVQDNAFSFATSEGALRASGNLEATSKAVALPSASDLSTFSGSTSLKSNGANTETGKWGFRLIILKLSCCRS